MSQVAHAGQSAQAVFRTKAAVKSQDALSEHWQQHLGFVTHSILNWSGVYSETVYCSQLSFLPTFTDAAPCGVRLSLRSWGPASTLSKWGVCPCEADRHVTVVSMPHTRCQMNVPGDSDRLTPGEQEEGKSACRLELESGGQQECNFILWGGQGAKSMRKQTESKGYLLAQQLKVAAVALVTEDAGQEQPSRLGPVVLATKWWQVLLIINPSEKGSETRLFMRVWVHCHRNKVQGGGRELVRSQCDQSIQDDTHSQYSHAAHSPAPSSFPVAWTLEFCFLFLPWLINKVLILKSLLRKTSHPSSFYSGRYQDALENRPCGPGMVGTPRIPALGRWDRRTSTSSPAR